MKIEWRDIKGYEGFYQVSNNGFVRSNIRQKTRGGILRYSICHGYKRVILCKNGIVKGVSIHRLVAEAFLSNQHGYDIINHKDENKQNNTVDNLEWCKQSYNVQYSRKTGGILQFDTHYNLINRWESANQAKKKGFDDSAIIKCCKGIRSTHKGYIWRYDELTA